jgi:bacteriocin-like protein
MKKPKRKPQRDQRSNDLTDKQLAAIVGGRLDNAPINVVSDYNPDSGG